MYFLCGNANKIYLDALWRRHSALLPPIAENPCECKIPAEYTCPETVRVFLVLYHVPKKKKKPSTQRKTHTQHPSPELFPAVAAEFDQTRSSHLSHVSASG